MKKTGTETGTKAATTGSKKHTIAERRLADKILDNPNLRIRTEVTYYKGEVVRRGTKGAIRVDAIDDTAKHVYDFKFMKDPYMSARRRAEIMSHIPSDYTGVTVLGP